MHVSFRLVFLSTRDTTKKIVIYGLQFICKIYVLSSYLQNLF